MFDLWIRPTPTPWLTLLLVLGKSRVNQVNKKFKKIRVSEGIFVS
jgi:hypothetical protein